MRPSHARSTESARTQVFDGGRIRLQPRWRLLEQLREETGSSAGLRRLTVVRAPTGYSKTRTVEAWLGSTDESDETLRWVTCRPSESLWSQLQRELTTLIGASNQLHENPIQATMHAAERLSSPITLIIDDYHVETNAENDIALADLSSISAHLTLIVITRRVTLLDRTLVTARTRVRLIDTSDLSYTLGEMSELAHALGIPLTHELQLAFSQTGGWPLAIRAALNLGSDSLYLGAPDPKTWNSSPDAPIFDAITNLNAFAIDSLELLDAPAREVILAASQLDALSLRQIQHRLHADFDEANAVAQHLVELGLLFEMPGVSGAEYRCHSSVKPGLGAFAERSIDPAKRADIYRRRASEVAHNAPLNAFKLYCAAEDFAPAEELLACNFTTLTEETTELAQVLRTVPEDALLAYPTLTAAQLFLKIPQANIASATIEYLVGIWAQGLQLRLPDGIATTPDSIHLPLLCQTMVATRLTGRLEVAETLLRHLDSRLIPNYLADDESVSGPIPLRVITKYAGSLPIYFREAAATALVIGDLATARRNLVRLKKHSERQISRPWHGFPVASIRTVTDAQSGSRWLITALSELAFTEMLDGDMQRSAELLAAIDAHQAATGAQAPGISWAGAEVARAHLAYELDDDSLFQAAAAKLSPLAGRLETWQLLLVAESAVLRSSRGPDAALAHVQVAISQMRDLQPAARGWSTILTSFAAMLSISTGNFSHAAELIASASEDSPGIRLERARLALFSGDPVEALLLANKVTDIETTKRQQVDRFLITAVAAWENGHRDEALFALDHAARMIERYWLGSKLRAVPYESLHSLAIAARDAGVCDLVTRIESAPEYDRPRSFRPLTEMELRTLNAIAQHRTTSATATALYVTPGTIKKHLASVYRKLGVNGRDDALLTAGRMGLLNSYSE